MKLHSIGTRLLQVSRFGRSALSLKDFPSACLLGIARGSPFNGSNRMTSFGRRHFPLIDVRPRPLQGGRVWIDTSDLGQLISYDEIMVEGCYDFGLVPFIPSAVVDCGAHVGFFTLLAAALYPEAHVQAFEPNPINYTMLQKHCSGLGGRVKLFQAAVSTEEGESWFEADFSNSGRLTASANRGVRVKVMDLNQVITNSGNGPLLLKIDVEGEERKIVPSVASLLPAQCAVFFETHHATAGWKDVTNVLMSHGFTLRLLRQRDQFCDGFAVRA